MLPFDFRVAIFFSSFSFPIEYFIYCVEGFKGSGFWNIKTFNILVNIFGKMCTISVITVI